MDKIYSFWIYMHLYIHFGLRLMNFKTLFSENFKVDESKRTVLFKIDSFILIIIL